MVINGTLWILLAGGLGGLIGAALGSTRSCQTGTCPLTANPLRGGVVGTVLGLTLALAAGVGSGSGAGRGMVTGNSSGAEYGASLTSLTPETFEKTVAEGVTLVDFWSPKCSFCLQQMPILAELAPEVAGKFAIAKVNVREHKGLAKKYGIRRLPTLMFFRDGTPVETRIGASTKMELLAAFAELSLQPG